MRGRYPETCRHRNRAIQQLCRTTRVNGSNSTDTSEVPPPQALSVSQDAELIIGELPAQKGYRTITDGTQPEIIKMKLQHFNATQIGKKT
jgi:hypothetical protein